VIGISSVLAVLAWNAGMREVGAANGMLFINFVPVTAFAIGIAQGHRFHAIELLGATLVVGALIANTLIARRSAPSRDAAAPTPRAPIAALHPAGLIARPAPIPHRCD